MQTMKGVIQMTRKASCPFEVHTMSFLRDPEQAARYLEEAYEDGEELFLLALRNVAKAQKGGVKGLAKAANLTREHLYTALSKEGNPRKSTIKKVLDALGMKMQISIVLKENLHA